MAGSAWGRFLAGLLAAAAVVAVSHPARSEPQPVVVELFTSQGCSSCPPADRLLAELADDEDVIALALHVDYWDYIGWEDSFARPEHTTRQKAYARAAGKRMIYTPQMVVAGTSHVVGTRAMELMKAIETQQEVASIVPVHVTRYGDRLEIRAEPPAAQQGGLTVQLVRYRPEAEVRILRGENAGRELSYANIVTAWDKLSDWDGRGALALDVALRGSEPAVVLVQRANHGAIVGAAATR